MIYEALIITTGRTIHRTMRAPSADGVPPAHRLSGAVRFTADECSLATVDYGADVNLPRAIAEVELGRATFCRVCCPDRAWEHDPSRLPAGNAE